MHGEKSDDDMEAYSSWMYGRFRFTGWLLAEQETSQTELTRVGRRVAFSTNFQIPVGTCLCRNAVFKICPFVFVMDPAKWHKRVRKCRSTKQFEERIEMEWQHERSDRGWHIVKKQICTPRKREGLLALSSNMWWRLFDSVLERSIWASLHKKERDRWRHTESRRKSDPHQYL